ncbi:MAG: hypothetical protein ACRD0B_12735, partial [Acidimicrobiales bacterium]
MGAAPELRRGTLQVQSVRYGGSDEAMVRMVRSVAAESRTLFQGGETSGVTLVLGDCGGPQGPDDCLPPEARADLAGVLAHAFAEAGAGAVDGPETGTGVRFDYVAFGANLGHGPGQNRLAARAAGSAAPEPPGVLVFLNPDTYLVPSCLHRLLEALAGESVGIAEARQIPLEHPKPFDAATGDTPWASGCAMAVRADLFNSLDGFEESLFLQGDDVDLCWRARMSGWRVVHVP